MHELPMFPLGTVLFPHQILPLHVFEGRYRALVRDCLVADAEFGVVLIERGSEVGGGDTRFSVGTVARIVEVAELPDGRYALATVGTRRVRVARWLEDAPYPRAVVEPIHEESAAAPGSDGALREVERLLRRVHAARAELGEAAAPVVVALEGDDVDASFRACGLAPLGPLDAQSLLELPDVPARLAALDAYLREELEVLTLRLEDD